LGHFKIESAIRDSQAFVKDGQIVFGIGSKVLYPQNSYAPSPFSFSRYSNGTEEIKLSYQPHTNRFAPQTLKSNNLKASLYYEPTVQQQDDTRYAFPLTTLYDVRIEATPNKPLFYNGGSWFYHTDGKYTVRGSQTEVTWDMKDKLNLYSANMVLGLQQVKSLSKILQEMVDGRIKFEERLKDKSKLREQLKQLLEPLEKLWYQQLSNKTPEEINKLFKDGNTPRDKDRLFDQIGFLILKGWGEEIKRNFTPESFSLAGGELYSGI
jgi:hypothetical protein